MITRRALAALLGLAVVGCTNDQPPVSISSSESQYHGNYLENGMPVAEIELTDQAGQPYQLTNPGTEVVVLFFGYTNCPDVCPGILADMAAAKRRLPEDLAQRITLVMVTTDPARDTPQQLADYLGRIDASFVGLTGDLDQIVEFAQTLGIAIEDGKKLPSGGYEVDHGTQVLGIDKEHLVRVVWSQTSIKEMREDYARLVAAQDA